MFLLFIFYIFLLVIRSIIEKSQISLKFHFFLDTENPKHFPSIIFKKIVTIKLCRLGEEDWFNSLIENRIKKVESDKKDNDNEFEFYFDLIILLETLETFDKIDSIENLNLDSFSEWIENSYKHVIELLSNLVEEIPIQFKKDLKLSSSITLSYFKNTFKQKEMIDTFERNNEKRKLENLSFVKNYFSEKEKIKNQFKLKNIEREKRKTIFYPLNTQVSSTKKVLSILCDEYDEKHGISANLSHKLVHKIIKIINKKNRIDLNCILFNKNFVEVFEIREYLDNIINSEIFDQQFSEFNFHGDGKEYAMISKKNLKPILIDLHKLGIIMYFNEENLNEIVIPKIEFFNNVNLVSFIILYLNHFSKIINSNDKDFQFVSNFWKKKNSNFFGKN